MSKRIIIIITAVLLILITSISIFGTVVSKKQKKEIENYMNYINSQEIGNEVKSPEFIHVVLSAYKGKAKGTTIVKSISYFKNNTIPDIQKHCGNKFLASRYYKRHSNQLNKEFGISSKEEFYEVVDKCKQLGNMNNLEYIRFDADSIDRNSNSVNVYLKMKSKESKEVTFNVEILNTVYSDRTSVIIK